MKRLFLYITLVVLSVTSCLKFEDAEPLSKVTTSAPTIEISAVGDSTFTATVTPAAGTNFYSYAVLEGKTKSVSASQLLSVKVGSKIAEGYSDVTKESTKTIVAKKLMPNTDYTVYAVATSEQGQVTEVTAVETHTSDGLNPTYKAESKDGAATLTFSENVKLNKEGKAYATYYKVNNPEDDTTIVVPTSKITVKGNVVTFPVIDTIPGAYVIYTWEKGLFKDGVDSVAAGNSVNTFGFDKDGKVDLGKSVGSRIPTEAWDFTWTEENKKGDTLVYFSDYSAVVPMFKTTDRVLASVDKEADWVVKVRHNYNDTEYLYPVSTYTILNDTTFAFMFDEEPEYTTDLDILIAEGVIFDEYGNPNNAFEREAAYNRFLESDGLEGVYAAKVVDAWGDSYSWEILVEEVDETTFNVYGIAPYSLELGMVGPLTATWDEEKGTLALPYGPYDVFQEIQFLFLGYTKEGFTDKGNCVLELQDNGWLESQDPYAVGYVSGGQVKLADFIDSSVTFIKVSNTLPTSTSAKAAKSVPAYFKARGEFAL